MTNDEILAQLRDPGIELPREALAEIRARREDFVPVLIAEIERFTAVAAEADLYDSLPVFALYLLAEFQEPRALEPILACFALDSDELDLCGDVICEDGHVILAALASGKFERLAEYARQEGISPWVRAAVFQTFVLQVARGELPRETVVSYFNELMASKAFPDEDDTPWTLLVAACLDMHPDGCLEGIRDLYQRELVSEMLIGPFGNVEEIAATDPQENLRRFAEKHPPLTDTAEAVAWWDCFNPDSARDPGDEDYPADDGWEELGIPIRREQPKIGRNDQCPCGSGKKYKKCCMPPGA